MNKHIKLLILTWLAEQVMGYTVLRMADCHQEVWASSTPHKVLVVDSNEDLRFANWSQTSWWLNNYWDPLNDIAQTSELLETTEYPYEWGRRKFVLFTQVPELTPGNWSYACVIHPSPSAQVYVEVRNTPEEVALRGDDVPVNVLCLVAVRVVYKLLGVTDDDWNQIMQANYTAEALARIHTQKKVHTDYWPPPSPPSTVRA